MGNPRIRLMDLALTHLDSLYEITSDYDVMQFIGNLQIWDYKKTKKFIEYGNSDDYYYKAIIIRNKLVGVIGVYKKYKTNFFVIYLNKRVHHKGIASVAFTLFMKDPIVKMFTPLYADVLDNNQNSIKFFNKLQVPCTKNKNIIRYYLQ